MNAESSHTESVEKDPDVETLARRYVEKERGVLSRIHEKFQKHTRALVLMSALAAAACSQEDAETAEIEEPTTASTTATDRERIEAHRELREAKRAEERELQAERLERAAELATAMGIDLDPAHTPIKYEAHIPTVIDGEPVPQELYTEEERALIEDVRDIGAQMEGDTTQEKSGAGNAGGTLESMDVDTSHY